MGSLVGCRLWGRTESDMTKVMQQQQAPLSMEFSRQEYWSGKPFPSSGDLRNTGIEPRSPILQVDALPSEPPGKPMEVLGPYQMDDLSKKI